MIFAGFGLSWATGTPAWPRHQMERVSPGRSPRPSRKSTKASFGSIRQHVFIVRHRVRILTGFVGVGSQGAWWGSLWKNPFSRPLFKWPDFGAHDLRT